ncbi:MAG: GH36-type glycosyl hydrolase domain-containing protein [Betaproteobacteria bacterium]
MARSTLTSELRGLLAAGSAAPQGLADLLDAAQGALPPQIRSEIFGVQRFAQHGRSLGETHRAVHVGAGSTTFFPRLRANIEALRRAHAYLGRQAATGEDLSPAAEWLLDNFHLVEAQFKEIHAGLPRGYFRTLPVLREPPLAGLPRVYGLAWAFVAHTDGAFDAELLAGFLVAYQESCPLALAELWALPNTLRVVLIENLRRLAEAVAADKAVRELADRCCDRIDSVALPSLDRLLARLDARGVGRSFLAQMAQRLHDHRTADATGYHDWLRAALPDPAAALTQHSADQAADNLSVSNAVRSLRAIGDADWADIVARASPLMRLLLTNESFAAEHVATRDQTLHGIERLARRSGRGEVAVAQALLALMASEPGASPHTAVACHWLQGAGRPALLHALGLSARGARVGRFTRRWLTLPLYLTALLLGTWFVVDWLLRTQGTGTAGELTLLVALLMAFPASEAVLAVIHRVIAESTTPRHLPRLALAQGIPAAHRVLVAIPAMLTGNGATDKLAHRLLLHHLANPERPVQFALLTDWADADTHQVAADEALLLHAREQIRALNLRYPATPDAPPRFILLHRKRHYSETERRWIGWERKRGKLELLVAALSNASAAAFLDLGADSHLDFDTRYILTLDSDTQLPPGRLLDLVALAAHPYNQPRLAADGRSVVGGYGILQPRVATPLPAPKDFTPYHWLFAGQCGIDPYSAASSELYQDLFGEGSFSGKGLLNVRAMHAVLAGRLPAGQVLSHDLLEGALARCAAVTDVTVIEAAPFHADVAAARVHRWTRGDWQLLPFVLQPWRYGLCAVNRWKMLDNLRRSLLAPASLALLLLALAGAALSPWAALALVLAATTAGPLLAAAAGLLASRADLAWRHFYLGAATDLARALGGGLWFLAQLLPQALAAVDAILRALYRTLISRRWLLQWTTAATVEAAVQTGLSALLRAHWRLTAVALLLGALLFAYTPHPVLALALCLLWAATPLAIWWVSRPRPLPAQAELPAADQLYLHGIARDSWRLFERCVTAADRHLPPDNLQVLPHDALAHRSSPTNIGLYLLAAACARQFGWIGTQELLARLEATLATLATLERHRGHFLNWYDTQTGAPLLPRYVSTVDSGNLSGHLLAVAQACLELARAPDDGSATRQALALSRQRLIPLRALLTDSALASLFALDDPLAELPRERFESLLDRAEAELAALVAPATESALPSSATPTDELHWRLADLLATLRSAALDARAAESTQATAQRLRTVADDCARLAWQADFGFLYHPQRHLFHIGYRVAEQQLDAGFYDLLPSEARLTSLLAIAKGDVPVGHWAALGRLFFAVGADAGLRSWSGSMFEYLMPTLVVEEPQGSVLRDAGHAAVVEQIHYARHTDATLKLPWGISESAYAGRDHTLAYQYAPHGVPRLALRRTPPDERVIAPYATALAAQLAPRRATRNFAALEALGARGRYGFIEALDFSSARQAGTDAFIPVGTFMAHHQGMSIVALANVLLGGPAQRWGMADAHLEAVASLLHERAPRAVPRLAAPAAPPRAPAASRRALPLLRDVQPEALALHPTHLLSNGRYSVALRANGAGWSRWGAAGITRLRDDALRDDCGSFFYLRWPAGAGSQAPPPVSITQHPAPDPAAHYRSVYHADRVCFDAVWPGVQTHAIVWVSPEDDLEFRQVEVRNLGDETLEIELISAFEPTLADPRADEAHPAFSNLFLRAAWDGAQQALLFERQPRLAGEPGLQAAHFLAESDPQVVELRIQTDRQQWLGRNRAAAAPLAALRIPPASATPVAVDTGLDAVCVLALRLRIAPQGKARLTFATAAGDNGAVLRAVIDKYRHHSHVQRASLMSATLAGIRTDALGLTSENHAAVQLLTTAIVLSLTRTQPAAGGAAAPAERCDRRLLWRFGISGDRPILLVSAGAPQGLGLLRTLAQALRLWAWAGVACDLVVINAEPASYQMTLQRELELLRERHLAEDAALPRPGTTGLHLLRAEDLSDDELGTLRSLARLRLRADGRPLTHHVQAWSALHEQAYGRRQATAGTALAPSGVQPAAAAAPQGEFAAEGSEFRVEVASDLRPLRPWINVLSNPTFGAQISEAGGGYSWAINSRLNQLTAWSNDPVADPPAEWFLLQDCKTGAVWSAAPGAWGDGRLRYRVTHGQGYTAISHRRGDIEATAAWCVDAEAAIKQVSLRLVNHGSRTRRLRVAGIAEWMMGANRADRATVHTAMHDERTLAITALYATQDEQAAGFGEGTAFLACLAVADQRIDWTCDRREFFDTRGQPVLPEELAHASGAGLDPCAALSVRLTLAPGARHEQVFLLGYAESPEAARRLVVSAASTAAAQRLAQVRGRWDRLLGATTVKTPDALFDALVNRWLLYQTLSCRIWAKAGFYQAGGATGFRDQLQDTLALAWTAPELLRAQILLCASRQFAEGDVQHWWHAPRGAGVRTHISDDLLWLALACVRYLRATGDTALLDEQVPFIAGPAIPAGAEDAYFTPTVSADVATVYEHAARAIDRSLAVGEHGLPLMGSGDWNDGMNRVGFDGRGESVWLGWFLCALVADFAPLAHARGEAARAQRWEDAARGWQGALAEAAWDGQWFKRAFFDDGSALGASTNAEARIDLVAQTWAVLSNAATPERQRQAMDAVEELLVDRKAGLIRLLDPPLVHAVPSAGYIQAYPPGVRENGGQYAHAAVWALMARAALDGGDGDAAYRYFTYLSPAHRARHPARGAVYGLEPYAMAGDIYSQPPYVGRGGWSWYTGAAAWLHRAAIESMFGLQTSAQEIVFRPCLPKHWPRAELTLRRDGRELRFILIRGDAQAALAATATDGAQLLRPGQPLRWRDLPQPACFAIPLLAEPAPPG